jgi:hypothetical protein
MFEVQTGERDVGTFSEVLNGREAQLLATVGEEYHTRTLVMYAGR